MAETKTNVRQIRSESATKKAKTRKVSPKKTENENESAANTQHIRYVYAPLMQQFRAHTRKNEARLWLPVETNLISRYEYATLTTHTRYIFVAIMLYMAGNGINEIPLDARFMSSVLSVDFRTIEKSFDELLSANLLQERKERVEKKREEQTDRQEKIALDARVSVSDFNSFSESNQDEEKTGSENGLLKIDVPLNGDSAKKNLSRYSIDQCLQYVELCKVDGEAVQSPKALASSFIQNGRSRFFYIRQTLSGRSSQIGRAKIRRARQVFK